MTFTYNVRGDALTEAQHDRGSEEAEALGKSILPPQWPKYPPRWQGIFDCAAIVHERMHERIPQQGFAIQRNGKRFSPLAITSPARARVASTWWAKCSAYYAPSLDNPGPGSYGALGYGGWPGTGRPVCLGWGNGGFVSWRPHGDGVQPMGRSDYVQTLLTRLARQAELREMRVQVNGDGSLAPSTSTPGSSAPAKEEAPGTMTPAKWKRDLKLLQAEEEEAQAEFTRFWLMSAEEQKRTPGFAQAYRRADERSRKAGAATREHLKK